MNAAAQRLEECIEQLKRGELTEERLRDLGKSLRGERVPDARVCSTCMRKNPLRIAAFQALPIRQTLLPFLRAPSRDFAVAVNAGWRVIRFPAQLLSSHSPDLHVTCEFILEKWE